MRKAHGITLGVVVCLSLVAGMFIASYRASLAANEDCIGQPYGTAGCPLLKGNSTSSTPKTCGNGKLDADEECDNGAQNGTAENECSAICKLRYCGDGVVQTDLNEECEPPADEVYAAGESGTLIIERQFNAPQCGNYCTPPSCDADGNCSGGCTRQFLPACQDTGSGTSVSSDAQSSTGSSVVSSTAASSKAASSAKSSAKPASSKASVASSSASSVSSVARTGLTVLMNGPLATAVNQNNIFSITIKNWSSIAAKNVVVNDYLVNYNSYGGFSLNVVDAGVNCKLTSIAIRCDGISVPAGETRVIHIGIVFLPSTPCIQRSVQAYATVTGSVPEADSNDNESEPVWTTIRCGSEPAPLQGTSSESSSGTGSSVASVVSSAGSSSEMSSASSAPAVCGNSVVDAGEECDMGAQNGAVGLSCSTDCKNVYPPAPQSTFDQMRPLLIEGSIGVLGLLILVYLFIIRKKILGLFHRGGAEAAAAGAPPKSLDDVPLDEIEMPWRQ